MKSPVTYESGLGKKGMEDDIPILYQLWLLEGSPGPGLEGSVECSLSWPKLMQIQRFQRAI